MLDYIFDSSSSSIRISQLGDRPIISSCSGSTKLYRSGVSDLLTLKTRNLTLFIGFPSLKSNSSSSVAGTKFVTM